MVLIASFLILLESLGKLIVKPFAPIGRWVNKGDRELKASSLMLTACVVLMGVSIFLMTLGGFPAANALTVTVFFFFIFLCIAFLILLSLFITSFFGSSFWLDFKGKLAASKREIRKKKYVANHKDDSDNLYGTPAEYDDLEYL